MPTSRVAWNPRLSVPQQPSNDLSALFSTMGGGVNSRAIEEAAANNEIKRLMDLDLNKARISQATASSEKDLADAMKIKAEAKAAEDQRALVNSPGFMESQVAMRNPTLPRQQVVQGIRSMQGGPFNMPGSFAPADLQAIGQAGANIDLLRLAKPSTADQLGKFGESVQQSQQRGMAPELVASDPIKAAFLLSAANNKDAPELYKTFGAGLGTINPFTGTVATNGLYDTKIGEGNANIRQSDASAMASRAAAGNSAAHARLADAQRGEVGKENFAVGQTADGRTVFTGNKGSIKEAPMDPTTGKPYAVQGKAAAGAKPMPAAALKLQNEELDAIGTASTITSQLDKAISQIDSGELQLGPVKNMVSQGQNLIGASSAQSRNFASFKATLEKLRNDSLRLNKGVQTEGDAVRAWNEVLSNINDPKLVRQRLKEVSALNQRAVDLRKLNVENIRANYGQEPMDVSGYTGPKATTNVDSLLNKYAPQ